MASGRASVGTFGHHKLNAIPVLQANSANAVAVKQAATENQVLLANGSTAAPEAHTTALTGSPFETLKIDSSTSAITQLVNKG